MSDQRPSNPLLEARAAFVEMIKEENVDRISTKWSLAQHWAGATAGFKDEALQRRWIDFYLGWKAHTRPVVEPETEHCPDCHSAFWYSRNGVTGAQETCKNKWHDRAVQPPKGGPGSIQHRFDSLCAWLREKFDLEPNVFSSIAPETWIKEGIEHALEQRATVPPGNEWRSSKELPSGDSVVLTFDGYVFSCEYAYDVNPKEHLFWMRIPALPPSVSTKLEGQS